MLEVRECSYYFRHEGTNRRVIIVIYTRSAMVAIYYVCVVYTITIFLCNVAAHVELSPDATLAYIINQFSGNFWKYERDLNDYITTITGSSQILQLGNL